MSSMDWAKEEIRLAIKEECGDKYGEMCFKKALKAYKMLYEDGLCGMSMENVLFILTRLVEGKTLTSIEDVDDVWTLAYTRKDTGVKLYQCKRNTAVFKRIHPNGTITYDDVDRVVCYDISNPDMPYFFGMAKDTINKMYPIIMPYYSNGDIYKVYTESCLFDRDNHCEYDTIKLCYVITPDGKKIDINLYFKENTEGEWVTIKETEHRYRMNKSIK